MTGDRILTGEHIAAFRRDGYVVVRGMYDTEEMARLSRWTDELEELSEVPGEHMVYYEDSLLDRGNRIVQRIENFYPHHRSFHDFLDDRLRQATAELFDEAAVLYKDKINFKKPGGDGFKPHQDQQAGWNSYAELFITAMVSIDAATPENGCLEMVAGHHRAGLIGEEWTPLTDNQMVGMDMVACPTRPGDVVLFDSYAPHGSSPNLSKSERRILYITYNRLSDGDHRAQYFADKRSNFPPDIERVPGREYVFRV